MKPQTMKPQTKNNLQTLFLCAVALCMGLIRGMSWQMEVGRKAHLAKMDAVNARWEKDMDDIFVAGQVQGRAQCLGKAKPWKAMHLMHLRNKQ